jgi:beta-lactamase superfamily II metal-dependent hydrolase
MHKRMSPHGDFDHMGEAINLVNNFKVEKVIFNCGPHNDLEQELIKVLDNLNNSKIYRTDEDGSIMFKIKNNKLKIEACSP